jgi:PPOX class probable F420-dependent enzyme
MRYNFSKLPKLHLVADVCIHNQNCHRSILQEYKVKRYIPLEELHKLMTGHIPWRKIDLWLQGFRSIWLSSTRPDGRPHVVPIWYWWDGHDIYFSTPSNTQKVRNIAQQPWVIAHAGDGDDTIILEGSAEIVTDRAERERINTYYMEKYVDPHSGAKASFLDSDDLLYHIRVQHVMVWEYGIVATRTDWHFGN